MEIIKSTPGIEECWKNLPGSYLPWLLLCQEPNGMKWDELLLAAAAIAPCAEVKNLGYRLKQYAAYGFLRRKGHTWIIAKSSASVRFELGDCLVSYCGDPSILWGLCRYIFAQTPNMKLPVIDVINKRGLPPFLEMRWKQNLQNRIEKYLKEHDVRLVSNLWEE